MEWCFGFLRELAGVLLLLLLVTVADIWRRGYSTAISWPRLILLWTLRQLGSIKTFRVYHQFEKDVRRFDKVQSDFLLGRIRRCENTAYGRDHRFNSVRSVEDFRRTQPVTDYSYFQTYIARLEEESDKLALLGEDDGICMFAMSSGTTGTSKRIPLSQQCAEDMEKHILYGAFQYKIRLDLKTWSLRRMMNIVNASSSKYAKSGHFMGPASAAMNASMGRALRYFFTSPASTGKVKGEFESQYIHMLFGLRDKHIGVMVCVFIHNFLSMMKRMQVHQEDLVNDVRRGRVKEDLDISPEVRTALNAQLSPMPHRAAEIEREFKRGFQAIIPRLWPEMNRVSGLWSGSTNEIYYRESKEMVGPDIPIVSFTYSASEGLFGVNLEVTRPGAPRYALVPDTNFYEFLPIYNDRIPDLEDIKSSDLLLATELEVGQEYEMFITNSSGLYRYRLGDVLRVTGYYQQAPQMEFLYRSGQNLNVNGEKLSEESFFRALRSTASHWPAELKDYTVAGSQFAPKREGLLNPHYLVFVEVEGGELTQEHLAMVDKTLWEQDEDYARYRKHGKIAPMEVHRMPAGSFAGFKQHLLDTTTVSSAQFKMPRILKSCGQVDWFLRNLKGLQIMPE